MQLIKTHSLQIRKLHETKNKKLIFNTEKLVQLKRCLFTMHCIHHVPCICFWHWWEFKDALVAIASTSNPIFVFVGSGVSHLSPDITLLIMFGFKASTVCWPTRCGNNIAIPVFVPPVTGEFFSSPLLPYACSAWDIVVTSMTKHKQWSTVATCSPRSEWFKSMTQCNLLGFLRQKTFKLIWIINWA